MHPQSSTNQSPFSLVYGADAMIPVEPTTTKTWPYISTFYPNSEKKPRCNLATKQWAARKYNAKLHPRSFVIEDLVWRMASSARKKDDKFSANWDGPYRIREDAGGGAYRLEQLYGEEIPNTWNVSHLKFYFSWMCIVIEPILVTPGVLFFLTWSFFPKEGFGQGGFYDFLCVFPFYSFMFPTLTPSKRPGSNTLILCLIRLSSPPLPQVSSLGRTPLSYA